MTRKRITISLAALAITTAACADSTGVRPSRSVGVSFSTGSIASSLALLSGAPYDITVAGGGNTLVITRAQLVVREIELRQSTSATCTSTKSDDDCEEVELGPVLVDLPLTSGVVTPLVAEIPAGTYSEIKFEIHKPGDDTRDRAFAASNPTVANSSVRVEGNYNGSAFVFTSTVSQEVELEFNPPLVVDAAAKNVTIKVDVGSWFKASDGTVINPATANPGQPNASAVAARIKASLRGFDDDNKDGRDDSGK